MKLQNDLLLRTAKKLPADRTPVWLMRQAGRVLPEYRKVRATAGDFKTMVKTPELAAEVTSESFSPTFGKTLALGFVAPTVAAGSLVRAHDRIARLAALPFYDPQRRRPRDNPL